MKALTPEEKQALVGEMVAELTRRAGERSAMAQGLVDHAQREYAKAQQRAAQLTQPIRRRRA